MNDLQLMQFQRIRKVLNELYEMYYTHADDPSVRRHDGAIQISYEGINVKGQRYLSETATNIFILSKLWGDSDYHSFDDFGKALVAVCKWRAEYVQGLDLE